MYDEIKLVLKNNKIRIVYILVIITLMFTVNHFIHSMILYPILDFIYRFFYGVINVTVSLTLIYISSQESQNKKVELKKFIQYVFKDIKHILWVFIVYFIILFLVNLFTIPIVSMIVIQALFVFIWQAFIIDSKRKFEVFSTSASLVFENFSRVIKYLVIYLIVIILNIIIVIPSKQVLEIIVQYLVNISSYYFIIIFTILYMKLKEENI